MAVLVQSRVGRGCERNFQYSTSDPHKQNVVAPTLWAKRRTPDDGFSKHNVAKKRRRSRASLIHVSADVPS